ncbi:MAG TPA: alpha/beta hydrolase [Candidatus Angelobacter sp.]|nr:alpha/beta hydrolase [Candidatus Angelobacter sp.]
MAFEGFSTEMIATAGTRIYTLRKGSGPPLLLLHGYPQTHFIWHKVAERLSEKYTVVLTDLRGYGDSGKPEDGERHANYSFRAMAQDQVEVMRHFGYREFFLASHDRGARTAHRMCLDDPAAVRKVCFMDIVPTLRMYQDTNKEFATKYMWWFFLIQKTPLPEHMIGADPEFFLEQHFKMQNGTPGALTAEAMKEYVRCFCTPDAIHASCEDYRAAAGIDLDMDEADQKHGRKVSCPVHVLWGAKGAIGKLWDVIEVWKEHSTGVVSGKALNAGHYLAEEQPEEVLHELLRFFEN